MATQATDQMCEILVRKITTGEPLDDAEKAHLAVCASCMDEVVRTLDESATRGTHSNETAAGSRNGDLGHIRPEAKQALEHGRRVFEREFGISLAKE